MWARIGHADWYPAVSDLRATVRKFAARLRQRYASEIERDPRVFKRRVVFYLKRSLPPGPGRPCEEAVSKAVELRAQGKSWREIYPACLPGFAALDSTARQLNQSRLRSAVRSRQTSRRRRRKSTRIVPPCRAEALTLP